MLRKLGVFGILLALALMFCLLAPGSAAFGSSDVSALKTTVVADDDSVQELGGIRVRVPVDSLTVGDTVIIKLADKYKFDAGSTMTGTAQAAHTPGKNEVVVLATIGPDPNGIAKVRTVNGTVYPGEYDSNCDAITVRSIGDDQLQLTLNSNAVIQPYYDLVFYVYLDKILVESGAGNGVVTFYGPSYTGFPLGRVTVAIHASIAYIAPPKVIVTVPSDGATGVPVKRVIAVTFSNNVQAGDKIDGATVTNGTAVAYTYSISGNTLSLTPTNSLDYGTTYTVFIPAGAVKDAAGDLAEAYSFIFTTESAPSDGGAATAPPAPTLTAGTITSGSAVIYLSGSSGVVSFNLYESGSTTPVNPSPIVASSVGVTQYTVTGLSASTTYAFAATATDGEGQVSPRSTGLSVTTGAAPGSSPDAGGLVPPSFSDVYLDYWAYADIQYLAQRGYLHGMGNGAFAPEEPVTRAQLVGMLTKMLSLSGGGEIPFTDVSPSAWYYDSVSAAYQAGLIHGFSASLFAPDQPLTREQMAGLLADVLAYKGIDLQISDPATILARFKDAASIGQWAQGSAAICVLKGIINGLPAADGGVLFDPGGSATRAQAAAMLHRVMALF